MHKTEKPNGLIRYVILVVSLPTEPNPAQTIEFLDTILPELEQQQGGSAKVCTVWQTAPIESIDMTGKAVEAFGTSVVNNDLYVYRTLTMGLKTGGSKCLVVYDKTEVGESSAVVACNSKGNPRAPLPEAQVSTPASGSELPCEDSDEAKFLQRRKWILLTIWAPFILAGNMDYFSKALGSFSQVLRFETSVSGMIRSFFWIMFDWLPRIIFGVLLVAGTAVLAIATYGTLNLMFKLGRAKFGKKYALKNLIATALLLSFSLVAWGFGLEHPGAAVTFTIGFILVPWIVGNDLKRYEM